MLRTIRCTALLLLAASGAAAGELGDREAAARAEAFVRLNGYTVESGSAAQLTLESLERTTDRSKLLELRRGTLESQAFGLTLPGSGPDRHWLVAFRYAQTPLSGTGRVVAVSADGSEIAMKHQDFKLSALDKILAQDLFSPELNDVFEKQRRALLSANQEPVKRLWDAAGWAENLVGASGLSGAEVFAQGSSEEWYLKPVMPLDSGTNSKALVLCDVWSWERERRLDRVYVYLQLRGSSWLIVGAGESEREVRALLIRH